VTGPGGLPLPQPDLVLDCLGRPCPVPVIELARALPALAVGAVVEVVSDDPAAQADVPAFCRMRGHSYLGAVPRTVGAGFRVRRGA
jgi:TusA-related sulfurtransferase